MNGHERSRKGSAQKPLINESTAATQKGTAEMLTIKGRARQQVLNWESSQTFRMAQMRI